MQAETLAFLPSCQLEHPVAYTLSLRCQLRCLAPSEGRSSSSVVPCLYYGRFGSHLCGSIVVRLLSEHIEAVQRPALVFRSGATLHKLGAHHTMETAVWRGLRLPSTLPITARSLRMLVLPYSLFKFRYSSFLSSSLVALWLPAS